MPAPARRRRATSWRSWSACGGGSTAPSTRRRSTSPGWWAPSRPPSRAPRCSSTTTPRRRFIRGSLAALRRAVEEVGPALGPLLRGHRPQRRRGPRPRAWRRTRPSQAGQRSPLTRGMIGAHASFTPRRGEPRPLAARSSSGRAAALHVHVAEDRADVEDCRARYGEALPERLPRHGLLDGARAAAPTACTSRRRRSSRAGPRRGRWIAHNPRSNMNNAVGYAPHRRPAARGPGHRRHRRGHAGRDARRLPEDARRRPRRRVRGHAGAAGRRPSAGGRALRPALRQAGRRRARRPRGARLPSAHPAPRRQPRRPPALRRGPQPRPVGDGGRPLGGARPAAADPGPGAGLCACARSRSWALGADGQL